MVIPKPDAFVIQRRDKEVCLFQFLQRRLAVALAGERITQRPAQTVQHRRSQKEIQRAFRSLVENLLGQIAHDVPVAARERLDETGDVVAALHGERGDLQAGDPALGARFQRLDLVRRKDQSHGPGKKNARLFRRKTQLVGSQFGQLIVGAQARQRQRWIDAGRDGQMQVVRQVLDQVCHPAVDGLRVDDVIVFEDDGERLGKRGDFVDQRGDKRGGGGSFR